MTNLRAQLQQISAILPREHREMVQTAMLAAAELTLSRIHELATSYDLGSGVEKVEKEMRDDGSRSAKIPFPLQAPTPAPEPIAEGEDSSL